MYSGFILEILYAITHEICDKINIKMKGDKEYDYREN